MTNKKTMAVLGSLVLLAATLPLATAHLSSTGSYTSGALTTDFCRHEGEGAYRSLSGATLDFAAGIFNAACVGSDGVSGTYYGPAGAYLVSPTLFGSSDPAVLGLALCDAEVLSDGSNDSALDESDVDGNSNPGGLPDGTFDDGGFGAACHTQGHYDVQADGDDYNSPGCTDGDTDPEVAYANDAVSRGNVWIGAACDWKSTGGGQGLSTCLVNQVLGGPTVPGVTACVNTFLSGGTSGATFVACGGEGVADDVHYGHGGDGVAFPNYANDETDPVAQNPPDEPPCTPAHESAVVFVFEYVNEDLANNNLDVIPATAGWIDTR